MKDTVSKGDGWRSRGAIFDNVWFGFYGDVRGCGTKSSTQFVCTSKRDGPLYSILDGIDAIGRKRGRGGFAGGNGERKKTLNQLLVEMDGFASNSGVVVLAGMKSRGGQGSVQKGFVVMMAMCIIRLKGGSLTYPLC